MNSQVLAASSRCIVTMLPEAEFSNVAKTAMLPHGNALWSEYILKDYKVDMPVRVVISERGLWQKVETTFLQGVLSHVCM